jgi:D-alanine--poly(phosphoribitol) ligase subunit 1
MEGSQSKMIAKGYHYNLALKFYEVAARNASRTMLKYPSGEHFTFQHVNELSNRIARYFFECGLKGGDVVVIFNEKSVNAYASMLACLKIGAIYSNVDPASPWPRLHRILDTCEPALILFDGPLPEVSRQVTADLPAVRQVEICSADFQNGISKLPHTNLAESDEVTGSNPAYIMFTSGSTGFPKGAVMSHDNVLKFIEWGRQTFEVTGDDVFTNANPIYFDNSVFDFYVSVFNGAVLVPLGHEFVKNATQVVDAINRSGCTIWFSVPSLLVYLLTTRALKAEDFATIRRISFGGEGFPKNKLKQLFEMFGHRITLYNVYGPTECTCICSSYVITKRDFENMNELAPLGYLAPNFAYEILPLDTNPDLGELALTGPCVGLGYYNDSERTQVSFVQNPNKRYHQVMYRTGDVVERREHGYLHFKGRVDNQVKHMGYRIELEEVEAAFSTLRYVNEVGVIYEKVTPELGQIKAYVSVSDATMVQETIQRDIRGILPTYMVPRIIRILPVLPKNSNGKIDRKQLAQLA